MLVCQLRAPNGLQTSRRATDYPILRDFADYLAVSAVALAAALIATRLLPNPTASGILAFGGTYVVLIAATRWRRYGRFSVGGLRSVR